eukprot:2484066-Pleurochrysis_carterae.AAC.1
MPTKLRSVFRKATIALTTSTSDSPILLTPTVHVMSHPTQKSVACEESTFKVRKRCVSRIAKSAR